MAIAFVIATACAGSASVGTAGADTEVVLSGEAASAKTRPTTSQHCPDHRAGLAWYRARAAMWRAKMRGAVALTVGRSPRNCADARWLATVWRIRARNARIEYQEWHAYHWNWRSWLPAKWRRIGACETGYGREPGNWQHNSGTYQGAFGFAVSSWDAFVPYADRKARPYPSEAYLATPRQQYEVALAIWRRYGFSGWGCRGA